MEAAGEGDRIAVGQAVAGYGNGGGISRPPPGQPIKSMCGATVIRLRRGWRASMLMVRLFSCVQVQTDATALVLKWLQPLNRSPPIKNLIWNLQQS